MYGNKFYSIILYGVSLKDLLCHAVVLDPEIVVNIYYAKKRYAIYLSSQWVTL